METEYDKGITKGALVVEITKMVDILKADMQEVHIEYMINYILQHYSSYTISDITTLTDRLVKNNPYGKPILQNLIYELNEYSTQKQEFAVDQRIKENSIHKANIKEENRFNKMYNAMKKKAKEPVQSQKEKDARAIEKNNEKIQQMIDEGLM